MMGAKTEVCPTYVRSPEFNTACVATCWLVAVNWDQFAIVADIYLISAESAERPQTECSRDASLLMGWELFAQRHQTAQQVESLTMVATGSPSRKDNSTHGYRQSRAHERSAGLLKRTYRQFAQASSSRIAA